MYLKKLSLKKIGGLLLLGMAIWTLAACSSIKPVVKENDGKITICHATDKTDAPYDKLTLDLDQLPEHSKHPDDIIPAPVDGCPPTLHKNENDGKISICHATSSASNPYNEITIDFNGLHGHSGHKNDIIPAPVDGCPSVMTTPTITMTPTITQTPTITPTPDATIISGKDGKITICHATGKKGYVMITISINGLNGHSHHERDIIPAPASGCPN